MIRKITATKQSNTDLFNAFEIFDRENKGFFSLNELEMALREMPKGHEADEKEIADILALADRDGDGHVNFQGKHSNLCRDGAVVRALAPHHDSQIRRHMWVEFVGSLLCSERFFSGYSGFFLSAKTNMI